ncbi:MAG: sigma-70 family RNA polymerase sigma factor [Eubacterium sp.]|nr:sigma-70 family RNA polymerase sigma factor [Eubacterium sp.]MBR0413123.1 sigma-70 family RNA polymerase sigma factor [Eubacterium sp.]
MLILYLSLIDDEKDRSKFENIYYEYRERMFSAAFDVVKNNEDAEDAVQNAFVGIANNMNAIGDEYSKKTLSYVVKAAKNAAINIYNKKNKINTIEYDDELLISDNDFIDEITAKQKVDEIVDAIYGLKDTYKLPLYYYFVCDMKIGDIANLLGISTSAVKVRIHRGKKELLRLTGDDHDDK